MKCNYINTVEVDVAYTQGVNLICRFLNNSKNFVNSKFNKNNIF